MVIGTAMGMLEHGQLAFATGAAAAVAAECQEVLHVFMVSEVMAALVTHALMMAQTTQSTL